MNKLFFIFALCIIVSCSTTKNSYQAEGYGYTEKNPIMVGGVDNGPANERQYLNSLAGPKGETVSYSRLGSCCPFDSKNSPFGSGMLDQYEVTYNGLGKPVILYINMYDKGQLHAPEGFIRK